MGIYLSKKKIKELKKEKKLLEKKIFEHDEKTASEGTMAYSFKDAANEEMVIQTKRKRLREIESILKTAVEVKEPKKKSIIGIVSLVTLKDQEGSSMEVKLVDPIEADPSKKFISTKSPLGEALMEKSEGALVNIATGQMYTILKVE